MNTPDYWQLLKLTHEGKTIYKVFATWVGGYLGGDSWRINSGITKIIEGEDFYDFIGASGSTYRCGSNEHSYRTSSYSESILSDLIERANKVGNIEVIPFKNLQQELKTI